MNLAGIDEPRAGRSGKRLNTAAEYRSRLVPVLLLTTLSASAAGAEPGAGVGEKPSISPPKVWVSLSLAQDAQLVSGSDVCSRSSQLEDGYSCFRSQGSQYVGTPLPSNQAGGFDLATTRALTGIDLAGVGSLSLGARVGYVLRGGGPEPAGGDPFLPLHAEARLAYWFGEHAFYPDPVVPFVFGAGGLGQVDSRTTTLVREDPAAPKPTAQLDNPPQQELHAWKKSGVFFAAIGLGAAVALSERWALVGEARGALLFPSPGTAFSASFGCAVGL